MSITGTAPPIKEEGTDSGVPAAFDRRTALQEAGWQVDSTNWQSQPQPPDLVGQRRTVAYIPALQVLSTGSKVWAEGETDAPADAVFVEVYEVVDEGHDIRLWKPVGEPTVT